jgi:hypothetical protein
MTESEKTIAGVNVGSKVIDVQSRHLLRNWIGGGHISQSKNNRNYALSMPNGWKNLLLWPTGQ